MSIVSNHYPEVLDELNGRAEQRDPSPVQQPPAEPVPTPRKPRPKLARSVRLCTVPGDGFPGLVEIAAGKVRLHYWLTALPADFGRGFRLEKFEHEGGETYAVCLNGQQSTCCCKGHARHGHCKHVDAIQALVNLGKL